MTLASGRVALGRLLRAWIERGGLQERPPRRKPAEDHRAVAHRAAGLVQEGLGLLRLPQDEMVLGGQRQQRDVELAEVVRLGPGHGRDQRREDALAVGQDMVQGPVAKGLFHQAQVGHAEQVGEVVRVVGGLFKVLRGAGIVAGGHRQPAQFQMGNARQLVFELACGERGPSARRARRPAFRPPAASATPNSRLIQASDQWLG